MPNLNKTLLMGNLTRDPEVRYTPKGTAVCDISIAINRSLPPAEEGGEWREEVTYVDVTLWGTTAENAGKYLTKGRGVFIEGRLDLETWDDKQTGQKRSKLKVVAESVQYLPSKTSGQAQGQAEASAGSKPTQGQADASTATKPANHKRQVPARKEPKPERDPDLDAEPQDIPF